jgi:hypothetical protein
MAVHAPMLILHCMHTECRMQLCAAARFSKRANSEGGKKGEKSLTEGPYKFGLPLSLILPAVAWGSINKS